MGIIEEIPLTWGFIVIIAEAIIATRIFLEISLSNVFHDVISLPVSIIFFNTWFLALFFSLVICLSIAGNAPRIHAAKGLLLGLPIILLPPLGLLMGFSDRFTFLIGTWKEIAYDAITFTMFHEHFGFFFAVEIILFLSGVFFFLVFRTSALRSILGTLAAYGTLIFFGTQPVFFERFFEKNSFGFSHDQQFALLNIALVLIVCVFLFLNERGVRMRDMYTHFRPRRILFFLALCVAMIMGALEADHFYLFNFIIGLALFCLIVIHALVVNDIADVAIDRISNPTRLYVRGILKRNDMRFLSGIMLAGAAALLFVIGSPPLFIVIGMNVAASILYSTLRFRKSLVSFLFPALGWSSVVFYGFFTQGPDLTSIPFSLVTLFVSFFLLFCFFIPIKDIKDIAGDAKEGVKNYMTVFGYEGGRGITMASAALSFPAFAFTMRNVALFVFSIVFSTLMLFFIKRNERFGEQSFFLLLFSFLLTAIFMVYYL